MNAEHVGIARTDRHARLPLVLIAMILCGGSMAAFGQAGLKAETKDGSPTAIEFSNAAGVLSRKWKLAFVAEGVPLGAPSTLLEGPRTDEMMDDAIQRVATVFDYVATRSGNVVILTKRYSDPRDMPDVTLEECYHDLITEGRVLAAYNPNYPALTQDGDARAMKIAGKFTPEQILALQNQGLPVSDLSTEQREELWRIALSFYVQPLAEKVEATKSFLADVLRREPIFMRQSVAGVETFGFQARTGSPTRNIFFPISNLNQVSVGFNGETMHIRQRTHNGVPEAIPDDTDPQGVELKNMVQLPSSDLAMTLAQAVEKLNTRHTDKEQYGVDPSLRNKRVMVIGENYASAGSLISALARAYGLQIHHESDHVATLMCPLAQPPASALGLVTAVGGVIPLPMRHLLETRIKTYKPDPTSKVPVIHSSVPLSIVRSLDMAVLRSQRARLEPRTAAAPNKQLLFSSLSHEEQGFYAIVETALPFENLLLFCYQPLPPYIHDFRALVLTGSLRKDDNGKQRIVMQLSMRDPATATLQPQIRLQSSRLP